MECERVFAKFLVPITRDGKMKDFVFDCLSSHVHAVGLLLGLAGLGVLLGCGRPTIAPNHEISLHIADTKPGFGFQRMVLWVNDEPVYVEPEKLLDTDEFAEISVMTDVDGSAFIQVVAKKSVGDRLFEATDKNRGKLIAILVNGVALQAVPINSPFYREFRIMGDFDLEDGQAGVSLLTGYPPD